MPFTPGGIFFRELEGSPTFNVTRKTWTSEERIQIAWDKINDFIDEALPKIKVFGGFLERRKRRTQPEYDFLITDSLAIKPWYAQMPGGVLEVPASNFAEITTSFKRDTQDDADDEDPESFLIHRKSIGAEFLVLPPPKLQWQARCRTEEEVAAGGDAHDPLVQEVNKNPNLDITQVIPTIEHEMTWPEVIDPPEDAIQALVGTINTGNFFGALPGTLMFLGADTEREFTVEGQEPFSLVYRFSERNVKFAGQGFIVGWNHVFKPDSGQWEIPLFNGDEIYQRKDFAPLFQIVRRGVQRFAPPAGFPGGFGGGMARRRGIPKAKRKLDGAKRARKDAGKGPVGEDAGGLKRNQTVPADQADDLICPEGISKQELREHRKTL